MAEGQGPPLIVSRLLGGYGDVRVIRGVDLVVGEGQVVALLGANGAGKTTLLRLMAGVLKPAGGTITLAGVDVTRSPTTKHARLGMCYVPEGSGIFRDLTVRENFVLFSDSNVSDHLDVIFEVFPGLRNRLNQHAGSLSGGQQQMLALSRALLVKPNIVLLDEVSMGLAPNLVDDMYVAIRRLASTGITLVVVEQYVKRALEITDHACILHKGNIVFDGPPDHLNESEIVERYIGGNI